MYLSPTDRAAVLGRFSLSPAPYAPDGEPVGEVGGLAPYSAHTPPTTARRRYPTRPAFDPPGAVPYRWRVVSPSAARRRPAAPGVGRPGDRVRPAQGSRRRPAVLEPAREQAHLPAQQPPPGEDPRVPAAHAHPCRPRDHLRPPPQGPRRAVGLTAAGDAVLPAPARLRRREDFTLAVRRGTRPAAPPSLRTTSLLTRPVGPLRPPGSASSSAGRWATP